MTGHSLLTVQRAPKKPNCKVNVMYLTIGIVWSSIDDILLKIGLHFFLQYHNYKRLRQKLSDFNWSHPYGLKTNIAYGRREIPVFRVWLNFRQFEIAVFRPE